MKHSAFIASAAPSTDGGRVFREQSHLQRPFPIAADGNNGAPVLAGDLPPSREGSLCISWNNRKLLSPPELPLEPAAISREAEAAQILYNRYRELQEELRYLANALEELGFYI